MGTHSPTTPGSSRRTRSEGARIGVWRENSFEIDGVAVDADVSAIMDKTIAALKAAGATIVDPADIPFGDWANAEFPALLCEFKTDIASYLKTYTGPGYPKTLQDLIDFNNDHPELESGAPESNWNSLVFDLAQETNGRDADCAAQRAIATPGARAAIDGLMAAEDLDAIIAPTNSPAWVTDPVNGDLGGDFSTFIGSSGPPAVAGYRERHGARGLRRAAARRCVVHRRPLGRADADRPRLRIRAGDAGPRPAAVHPVDRRRARGGAPDLVEREAEGDRPGPHQQLEAAAAVTRLLPARTRSAGTQSPRRPTVALAYPPGGRIGNSATTSPANAPTEEIGPRTTRVSEAPARCVGDNAVGGNQLRKKLCAMPGAGLEPARPRGDTRF